MKNIEVSTQEEDKLNEDLLSLFTEVAERKKVGFFTEFCLVFYRMGYHVFRNPVNVTYLIFLGFFNSLMWLSVYHGVDAPTLKILTPKNDIGIVLDLTGFSYLLVFDSFINMCFGQVM